jgi:hypothetical protein
VGGTRHQVRPRGRYRRPAAMEFALIRVGT